MSALEELIKSKKLEAGDVVADKKPKLTGDAARDAVKKATALLNDGQIEDTETGEPAPAAAPAEVFSGDRLEPILHPNGQAYNPRILNYKTDVETARVCRDAQINLLLAGYPGTGKTAMLEAAFGDELITVECHGDMEVTDLVGNWVPQPDGSFAWNDGPLVRAMKEGRPLLLDDCTLTPAPVLARLYPAMDGRNTIRVNEHEGETVTAAPGFFVVGAHNPGAPGAILSEALASRFLVQFEVESDLDLALKLGVERRIVKAAKNLRTRRKDGTVTWAPEMRELLGFARVSKALGREFAAANMVSSAPEDARDAVIECLAAAFPGLEELALRG